MKKKAIIGVGIFAAAAVLMALVYMFFREKPVEGGKNITLEVVYSDGNSDKYTVRTDAKFLVEAMKEAGKDGLTFESEDGEFGPMVTSVNGKRAVYEKDGAYWSFYVNGEYCDYGISDQPVKDKDEFRIVYTKAQ